MRKFHLGDVLTLTTSRIVSPRRYTGYRDILSYMTREGQGTEKDCKSFLLKKFPQLAQINPSEVRVKNSWLDNQIAKYGRELEVEPLPPKQADQSAC